MLVELSIRDIVLIEKLDIAWHAGLCALTGETGAGKSILLDALGLALGFRAAAGLVRHGADQGSVTAEFDLPADHPARRILRDLGLPVGDTLALRRVLGGDGRSRAFLDDQPVNIATLRQLGESLVEFHVQGAERGLLDPAIHRGLLDEYGGLGAAARKVRAAHDSWRVADAAAAAAERRIAVVRADEDYLRHALGELGARKPVLWRWLCVGKCWRSPIAIGAIRRFCPTRCKGLRIAPRMRRFLCAPSPPVASRFSRKAATALACSEIRN